jgi:hypothetical protein
MAASGKAMLAVARGVSAAKVGQPAYNLLQFLVGWCRLTL